jgi:hypothetical protein
MTEAPLPLVGALFCQLANTDWSPPKQINIPDFTLKERLCVDSLLPGASADDLHNALGFKFDNKEKVSKEMLETYILFYKKSPLFSRILV